MAQRIVYQGDDGIAKVVVPSPSFLDSGRPFSDLRGRPTDGRPERIVDESEVPADRTFRNAWEMDETPGNAPTKVNMAKALPIAQDNVRRVREPRLEELDVAFMRAQEKNDSARQDDVREKKQRLRDATEDTRLTGATTPSELKQAMEAIQSEIKATTS